MTELEQQTSSPNLWDNPNFAQTLMSEKSDIEHKIKLVETKTSEYNNLKELYDLANSENDMELTAEIEKQLEKFANDLETEHLSLMLNSEADHLPAYVEIHAGAGGTEACDWAQMLLRMYIRWAESHKYKVAIIEEHTGDEAGIKSATIQITGPSIYGWLKGESGIHRLVRISPFDAGARRHTSFASVWVYPVVDDRIEIKIDEKDLRIDTYRSSGAGGQHVNKTDSAVRITHIPTGIVVQCQNERSQFKNKDMAFSMLRSRLYNLELEKRAEQEAKINASKAEIGWGSQIRSYVLQPYQMIKDLRTGYETSNINATLDGDIDGFLSATLNYMNIKK